MNVPYNMLKDNQIQATIELAKKLHGASNPVEKNEFAERIEPILQSPESKHFLIKLMDVAFRSGNYQRVSDYVINLFDSTDSHKGLFNSFESLLVSIYRSIGKFFPSISIPLMLKQIKKTTGPILFFVGDQKFSNHSQKRQKEGVKLNVNLIGEALIGEEEAAERIKQYNALLRQKDVNYISIKISTIFSQTSAISFDHTIEVLERKLCVIYDEIMAIHKETGEWKFVNLDMEEYRDLHMTIATFIKTLSLKKYKNLRGGIVLQAYLPDSYDQLDKLTNFALERVSQGGAPIKIRVVKGANMEMEKTEASLEDWPLAPYSHKVETDANFKKIILKMLSEERLKAVNLGIASHNIFDLAFALNIVKENNLHDYVDFEMLEGMANETVNRLLEQKVNVLLYTPIVKPENYNSAIAYLVRRLDEGTQDGNFLKEGFDLKIDSPKWEEIKTQFLDSVELMSTVQSATNRVQDRNTEKYSIQEKFRNVANTDWNLMANRAWLKSIQAKWENPSQIIGDFVPVVSVTTAEREKIQIEGWNGFHKWSYELATENDYHSFLSTESKWGKLPVKERALLLKKAAVELEKNRGNLMAAAVVELGKTFTEVDVELSEAVDFANFYAESAINWENTLEVEHTLGTNLILSPWNFPIAIPIGGVLASLAAGKRAILKPSTNAAATAYLTSKCLWDAGIPKDAFAFLPTEENNLDAFLSQGNTFDAVILTGGTETAKFLLKRNPELNLFAETGGKNSTIVTSLSDREQAIKNVVQSAFGNAGQKCSATSLLILQEEVFNDPHFKTLLKDATESKEYGNPWHTQTQIGPLAVPISEKLQHVLDNTTDSQWLLKPVLNGKFMLSPGIKWGVTTSDFEYNNELFGPILSVMKAKDLKEALELANGVEYGLTSGLESLDPDEVAYWKEHMKAGNLYVNRPTTGAIVLRQPFGGMKASCFGFGMKAGGLNYVAQFIKPIDRAGSIDEIKTSYKQAAKEHFNLEIDYVNLRGQDNLNRYLKAEAILCMIDKKTESIHIEMVRMASEALSIPVHFYSINDLENAHKLNEWKDLLPEINHSISLRNLCGNTLDTDFVKACHDKAIHIYSNRPSVAGRYELLNYITEQNFSYNYHRYGNLLGRTE